MGRFLGKRRRGGRRARGRALRAAHELYTLGDHLGDRALLSVLALPVARLQPALDEDAAALVEMLAARLRLLAPHDHGEEARFLPLFSRLRRVVTVDREPEIRDRGAAGRVAQFRGTGQVADQQYLVEARHQTTSSRTLLSPPGVSCAFLERAFLLRVGTRVDRKRRTFSFSRSCRSSSFTMDGSALASPAAYVLSRWLRMWYASRRFPQLSTLSTSIPSDLACSPTCVSSVATSSSVGLGSTITSISYGRSALTSRTSWVEALNDNTSSGGARSTPEKRYGPGRLRPGPYADTSRRLNRAATSSTCLRAASPAPPPASPRECR